jgi:hypothetical protein
MRLTWKDALATVFVGAAAVLYVLWAGGATVAEPWAPRALGVAILGLGVGACYTAKSHMETVYGVNGGPRPPLFYVVLVSVLGGVTLVAGIVAIATGGAAALATLTGAMVALWALATIRHMRSRTTPEVHPHDALVDGHPGG